MSELVRVWLPFPPSVNGLFAGKARRYPSPKYRAWKRHAGLMVQLMKARPRIDKPVDIVIRLSPPDKRPRDAGNYEKAVTDLLVSMKVIPDDRREWLRSVHPMWCETDPQGATVIITEAVS